MKKIFYILASAIVALGAVACENDGLDNIGLEVNGDTVSFVASIDNTKTALGADGKSTIWDTDDVIIVKCGEHKYTFSNKETGDQNKFSCTAVGVTEILTAETITATYANYYDDEGKGYIDSNAGTAGALLTYTGSFAELKDGKKGFEVTNAFLKFTTTEKVTLKGAGLFVENGVAKDEITITGTGKEQYVAVNPTTAEIAFSYSVGDVQCKSLNKNFTARTIYGLGALAAPVGLCYKGSWDNWTNLRGMFSEGDYYVAKNVVCPANTTFKFVIKSSNVMMGATSATTSLGTWNAFANNDIKIATAGTYNIYVSKKNGAWCVVKSTNTMPTLNKKYLYLMPNGDWKSANAKFGAWCYGGTANNANKNFAWAMWEGNNDYYYMDITGYKQFYIKRLDPNNTNTTWNEVGPITIGDNSLISITGWSSYKAGTLVP